VYDSSQTNDQLNKHGQQLKNINLKLTSQP
jgi:hypothetical protein